MKRTALAVCVIVAATLVADGQRRRTGVFRPEHGQPTTTTQPASASTPASASNADAAPASATASSAQQTYPPAIEYQSFMQLRFYENQGGFLVEDLEVVFPPAGGRKATFVVSRAGGGVVASVPLRLETPLATYTMFGMFKPDGVAGTAEVGQPGDYVLSVQIDGQPITTLPFTMKREASNDPFNPTTTFVREGPWRDLGYFSSRTDTPDSHLEFNWWTSLRELPPGTPRGALVTLHFMRGAQEIAATRSPVVISQTDWQFFYQEFHFPAEKQVRWMTLADLTKTDGEYSVVAKVNGKPFKSYRAEVRGGKLQRHPRNDLNTQPHTDFISPRLVDTSSRTTSNYAMRDTYWVKKM
jgi:hypothetical protein